jgi:hypothetical protein
MTPHQIKIGSQFLNSMHLGMSFFSDFGLMILDYRRKPLILKIRFLLTCRSVEEWTTIGLLEAFTISFSSIFGMTVRDANDIGTKTSARLTLFVIFICGSLFWYVYVGFLTSALAVPSEYKPFQSPEGLAKTNYR